MRSMHQAAGTHHLDMVLALMAGTCRSLADKQQSGQWGLHRRCCGSSMQTMEVDMHTACAPHLRACRKSVSRAITWHSRVRPRGSSIVGMDPTVLRSKPIVLRQALIPRDRSGLRSPSLLAPVREVDMMARVVTARSSQLQFQDCGAMVLPMVAHTTPCRQQSEPSIVER